MADRSDTDRLRKATPPLKRSGLGRSRLLQRFARAQDGATAVEFAFVILPFLLLIFSILELGLVFMVSLTLENALNTVDRKIRTGEFQTGGGTAASFRTAVCNEMSWLSTGCPTAIMLDVRTVTAYTGSSTLATPTSTKTCFDPGGASSIVLVRGYYTWPLLTPLLQSATTSSSGKRMVPFAALFTNEPYSSDAVVAVTCPT